MSRARDWTHPLTGETHWFDAHALATAKQLELLADVEGLEMDDLLEEGLSARAVLYRLNIHSNLIPAEVLERKRQRQAIPRYWEQPCRICTPNNWECEGRITRHHFVPRWLMLTLKDYEDYAPRTRCTIPVCVGRHRDLHLRRRVKQSKSIAPFLTDSEKAFAEKLIVKLKKERPAIYDLIASGTESSYEYTLVRDYQLGLFRSGEIEGHESVLLEDRTAVAVGEG